MCDSHNKEVVCVASEQAESNANEASALEDEITMRVTALEADLAAVQQQLLESRKEKEDAKPQQISSVISVQPREEVVLFDQQEEENIDVVASEEEVEEPVSQTADEMPIPDAVTDEQVEMAVFTKLTDKILFAKALSDIASVYASERVDAAKMMGEIRHELSTQVLARQMAGEPSAKVRQECVNALAAMEMTEALPAIKHALTDEAGSVRLAAVWGLYHLAGEESALVLLRMFDDDDEDVRRRAATCIGWLGKEELAVELLPLLKDDSFSVRRAAVEAMSNLRSQEVVSPLIEQLSGSDELFSKVVIGAVETITGKKMSQFLPKNKKEFERLIARWQQWRKEHLLG